MVKEWGDKYNPFNSWKALVHADKFEAILKKRPKNPIVINFDLTNLCNYNCRFCMFANRKRTDSTGKKFRDKSSLPKGYALKLPNLWKKWGVKAVCLAGGGEPTLHPDCLDFIKECKEQGLELGFVTNGLKVDNKLWWETICKCCKFVGFSIDAGNKIDYGKVKGVSQEYFIKVIYNLEMIAKTKKKLKSNVQIGFKFLLDKYNQHSIFEAANLAKKIGCNHFQFRPAIDDYVYSTNEISYIWNQIKAAQTDFDSKNFKVCGVSHKFNLDLTKKHCFNKCRANMLTSTWCANGKVYMCTDTRGNPWSYLIDHYPKPKKVIKFWGGRNHFEKVDKINHKKCDRCTLAPYNEIFEQVFLQDKMDRNLI